MCQADEEFWFVDYANACFKRCMYKLPRNGFWTFVCVLGVVLGQCLTSQAQALWSTTRSGMSLEDVRKVVPGTHAPSNPERFGDGTREYLRLDNVEVVGHPFSAHFYFKEGKLSQVTLGMKGKNSFTTTQEVFKLLSEPLRVKYGQEISHEEKSYPFPMAQATWMSGRTNINVVTLAVNPRDALLNINYQTRLAADVDKL